jgi:TRAP-type C4-dicarboxylate transport system permease small subunit
MKARRLIVKIEEKLDILGRFLHKIALLLCLVLAGADLLVVVLEVITRTAGSTIIWSEELSRWLLVWMTFVGASVVLREKGHIRVAFFISILPKRIGRFISLIGECGVLVFLAFFTLLAWRVAVDAYKIEGDIILLPMFYPKFGLVIGGGLMLIHQLHAVLQAIEPYRCINNTTETVEREE